MNATETKELEKRFMKLESDANHFATKLDIVRVEANMATKDDLAEVKVNMATKDDIKDMATKDDIKDMATKDDISKLEKKINNLVNIGIGMLISMVVGVILIIIGNSNIIQNNNTTNSAELTTAQITELDTNTNSTRSKPISQLKTISIDSK